MPKNYRKSLTYDYHSIPPGEIGHSTDRRFKKEKRRSLKSPAVVRRRGPADESSRSTVPGRNPLPLTVCTGSEHCDCQVRLSGGGRSDAAGQPYRPCRNLVGSYPAVRRITGDFDRVRSTAASPADQARVRRGTIYALRAIFFLF